MVEVVYSTVSVGSRKIFADFLMLFQTCTDLKLSDQVSVQGFSTFPQFLPCQQIIEK